MTGDLKRDNNRMWRRKRVHSMREVNEGTSIGRRVSKMLVLIWQTADSPFWLWDPQGPFASPVSLWTESLRSAAAESACLQNDVHRVHVHSLCFLLALIFITYLLWDSFLRFLEKVLLFYSFTSQFTRVFSRY